MGLGDKAKAKLRTLSGGMLRRVGIAQAIVNEPELLLLDEPTAGLDPEQRVAFRALLRDLGQRATVIVSTHLVEDVGAACTEVALMDRGKIVFQGHAGRAGRPRRRHHGGGGRSAGARIQRGARGGALMTATPVTRGAHQAGAGIARAAARRAGRLLRLELRRNVHAVDAADRRRRSSGSITYRPAMAHPPLWNVRAMAMQTSALAVFVPTVVGAAAWLGSREARHGMTDLLAGASRPRWARQLASWAATTCWALVAYLGCVAVLYAVTARQGAWGGPLWWPAVVVAASLPAFSALGFAAGALRPSRFTTPLVAVTAFLALELTAQFIHRDHSPWQVSPLVAGPWEIGPDQGVATFYPYLPDLPIVQLMFLAGLTTALLGVLGLPAGSGGRWLRSSAAALTTAGLLAAITATALAGTGQLDPHGMIAIPALHNPANDRPVPYTPVCSDTPIPVCLHPAYRLHLPTVTAALEPVLSELASLPGAPVRINQTAAIYRQESGNGVRISRAGPTISGTPPTLHVLLPIQLARPVTNDELTTELQTNTARDILNSVIGGDRRETTDAQEAIAEAILKTSTLPPGSPTATAAQRFAALPSAVRHAWLTSHVAALRAGQITLAELP